MNKLFTKIATAFVGMAMAIGVGVAVGTSQKDAVQADAAAAQNGYGETALFDGAKVLIVTSDSSKNKYYIAHSSGNSNIAQATYTDVDTLDESLLWNVTKSDSSWKFSYINNTTTYYLKTTGGNNTNTRIQNGDTYNLWTVSNGDTGCYKLKNDSNSRYLAVYTSGTDMRAYASTTQSGTDNSATKFKFYAPKYTVSYDANGGSGTLTDSNSPYVMGTSVTSKTNSFTRTGYEFTGWNTKADGSGASVNAGATFKLLENTTLYAQWEVSGTAYTVTDSITNGSLSSTADVPENGELNITIIPSSHYHLPDDFTVTMGGNTLKKGEGYLYYSNNGSFYIDAVTGDVVISGACIEDSKFTVTYVKGEHGTGSDYVVSNQYAGSYTLVDFATTGLKANDGYKFDHYVVGDVNKNPGDSITLSANITVTAVYAELSNKISIDNSDFVNTKYADNNKAHTYGDYEITTYQVMKSTAQGHTGEIQFQKDAGAMYNTTIEFSHGIKMVKVVGTGTVTVTFDTSIKVVDDVASAGTVESKEVVSGLGSNVSYYIPNTTSKCVYFHITAGATSYFTLIEVYSSVSAADEFANMYLNAYTCVSSGASAPSAKSGYTVANISSLYNKLDDSTKGLLAGAVDAAILDHDETFANVLEEFGCRYYWIVRNHGNEYDFMNKNTSINASARIDVRFGSTNTDSAALIIVIISLVSITAIGGYFFIRKRREQ